MPIVSLAEWKAYLEGKPHSHILQSGEWGELKSAFGWMPYRIISGGSGTQVLLRKLPFGYTVAYIPKMEFSLDHTLWNEVHELCKKKNSIFLKVEMDGWQSDIGGTKLEFPNPQPGFRISPHTIQPLRTLVIDIRGTDDDVLGRMKQKCRYNIRLAQKKGVVVRAWDDVDGFHRLMKVTGIRDGFGVHSLEYYKRAYDLFQPGGMVELFVAEYRGNPLAALMAFYRGKRSWYIYGASTDEERNRMPTYLLQWEAIRWARSKGAEEYDLWGVPDEDQDTLEAQFESRSDGLWGVYRFKRGFGGSLKRSVPAVDKIYKPFLYKLYLRRMSGREMG